MLMAASILFVLLLVSFLIKERPQFSISHRSYIQTIPQNLDPIMATDTNSQLIVNHLYDGLVSWSLEEGIQPMLAKSWSIKNNGHEIVFDLDERATFSDGSAIVGDDIVRCFRRLIQNENPFQQHFRNLAQIELVDKFRVKFYLKEKDTKFLSLLAGTPALISKMSNTGEQLFSGPYVLSNKISNKITLKSRLDYYGLPAVTKELHFVTCDPGCTLDQMIKDNQIDDAVIDSSPKKIKRTGNDKWVSIPMWATWAIGFDVRNHKVFDKSIRLEMARALSSEKFIEEVYPFQSQAFGIIPFGIPGYLKHSLGFEFTKRTTLGNQANVNVDLYIPSEIPNKNEIIQWLGRHTSNLDFQVNIIDLSFSQMIELLGKGKMSSFLLSFNAEFPSPHFFVDAFISSGTSNFYGVKQDVVLDLMKMRDGDQEIDSLKRLNSYLVSEAYVIPLMHVVHNAWMRDCVTGIKFSPVSEGYFSFRGVKNSCSKK